jgi:hypothetical protein
MWRAGVLRRAGPTTVRRIDSVFVCALERRIKLPGRRRCGRTLLPPGSRGSPDRSGQRTSRKMRPWRDRRRCCCRDRRRSRSRRPIERGLSRASNRNLGVGLQLWRVHQLDLHRALGVPELPDVEVPCFPVDRDDSLPPEHDVGRRLHHPLPFHYAPSMLAVLALPEERFEDGSLRFLELEEERVVLVAAQHQQDPGAGAHAADTDDLSSGMHVPVALE